MTDTFTATATVLLLDSDRLMRTVLHETLERAGYLVVNAGNLGAAVDRVKRMRPDLLIVRPYINSMPGETAAQYLRAECPGLAVLIVEGFIDDGAEGEVIRNAKSVCCGVRCRFCSIGRQRSEPQSRSARGKPRNIRQAV